MKRERSYNLPLLVFVLGLVGVSLSVVALYEHSKLHYGAMFGVKFASSFCNIGATFNCEAVNKSAWSYLFGVPVAAWGIWFYLTLMAVALISKDEKRFKPVDSNSMLLVVSTFAALFSLYLFLVSKLFIKTLCLMCVGMYVVNLIFLIAALLSNPEKIAWISRVKRGVTVLFRAPLQLRESESGALVYLFLLYSGAALLISLTLSEYLFLKIAIPGSGKQGIEQAVKNWETEVQQEIPLALDGTPSGDYFKGDLRASITIVEYADFECPACQRFFFEISDIFSRYKKDILFVYRNYPLSNECNAGMPQIGHKNACFAAHLSRCAGEQGAYWEMADHLFSLGTDPALKGADSALVRKAMSAGVEALSLDSSLIEGCVSEKRHDAKIQEDIASGNRLGLQATPSLWINGRQVKEPSADVVEAIVQKLLAKR